MKNKVVISLVLVFLFTTQMFAKNCDKCYSVLNKAKQCCHLGVATNQCRHEDFMTCPHVVKKLLMNVQIMKRSNEMDFLSNALKRCEARGYARVWRMTTSNDKEENRGTTIIIKAFKTNQLLRTCVCSSELECKLRLS
jgi:hypothetical protein